MYKGGQEAMRQAIARLDADQDAARRAVVQAVLTEQRGALPPVVHRVAATAGAGKTTWLLATVCDLLLQGVPPDRIALMTFTKKAATEMNERLRGIMRVIPRGLFVGTSHSFALRRLRVIDPGAGAKWSMDRCLSLARFDSAIPTERDVWQSVVGYRKGGVHGTAEKSLGLSGDWKDYAMGASRLRAQGLTPNAKGAMQAALEVDLPRLLLAWGMFTAAKEALKVWDFDDLLEAYVAQLRLDAEPRRWAFVGIDEAQDNNVWQLEMGARLARVPWSRGDADEGGEA